MSAISPLEAILLIGLMTVAIYSLTSNACPVRDLEAIETQLLNATDTIRKCNVPHGLQRRLMRFAPDSYNYLRSEQPAVSILCMSSRRDNRTIDTLDYSIENETGRPIGALVTYIDGNVSLYQPIGFSAIPAAQLSDDKQAALAQIHAMVTSHFRNS